MTEREPDDADRPTGDESIRLDKWLWFARFFKSRTLARRFLEAGKVRMRGAVVKPHVKARVDDVVTFTHGGGLRIVRVCRLGSRRGPAAEARTLYEDLSPNRAPAIPSAGASSAARDPGAGRPTKAERRALDRLRSVDEN